MRKAMIMDWLVSNDLVLDMFDDDQAFQGAYVRPKIKCKRLILI